MSIRPPSAMANPAMAAGLLIAAGAQLGADLRQTNPWWTWAHFAWQRVVGWLRKRHPGISWARLRRRFRPGWRPTQDGISLLNPGTITVSRYRYRGNKIPLPWTTPASTTV